MNLTIAVITATFGRGSRRPMRSAGIRLALLVGSAVGASAFFAQTAQHVPLATIEYPLPLMAPMLLVFQAACLVSLAVAAGVASPSGGDTLVRMLSFWPIPSRHRWILILLPSLIIAMLGLLVVWWPVFRIFTQLGAQPILIAICAVSSLGSALGLLYGLTSRRGLGWVAAALWIALLYKAAELAMDPLHNLSLRSSVTWGCLLGTCLLAICWYGAGVAVVRKQAEATRRTRNIRYGMPRLLWYWAKLSRSSLGRTSLLACMALSGIAAVWMVHTRSYDALLAANTAGLLAASVASDIRALAARIRPAEITALWGTLRFVGQELGVALIGILAGTWPLAYLLISRGDALHIVGPLALGTAAGLLASTIVVPARRDISGQFLAALLCIGLVFGLPQLPGLSHISSHIGGMLGLTGCCIALSGYIEYKRNPFTWRTI